MTRNLTVAAGALAAFGIAATAFAQTAPAARPAAPAAPQVAPGPVIPGVCTFSNDRAIGTSLVGKAVGARLQQLSQAADAELRAERTRLETEKRALEAQRTTPTMTQEQLEQRALTYNQQAAAFERKAQLRVRELQATEQKQLQRVAQELQPLILQAYAERNCGLMVDRSVIYAANPSMDVTDIVVQKLNAKITTLTFERERLDQPAAAAPARPAAAAPAAPGKKK
jgi:Skp family chaperone for outer membrane proteins